ncbi:MAG: DNA-directed RNA polymerase subunit omega [Candidatus Aminicenantes bacterium]|nr:DNA-directed RNA polymerase subunit omega [Candidatus Aminicenantes bacterium]NLH77760.1 DNA-directed RNA polymerase subunit omega [Acidobacteriota bacterium]
MDQFGKIDSKYRFIILASKRAKQLLKGAKPKIQTRSKSLIRIAQAEVREGLVEYEIIPARMDDIPEREDRVFVGGGIADEAGDGDSLAGSVLADEADAVVEDETEDEEAEDEDAGDEDEVKDDKDE